MLRVASSVTPQEEASVFRNVVCSEDYFIRVVPRVCGYVGVVAVEPVEKVSERSREAVYDSERFVVVVACCYDAVSERLLLFIIDVKPLSLSLRRRAILP